MYCEYFTKIINSYKDIDLNLIVPMDLNNNSHKIYLLAVLTVLWTLFYAAIHFLWVPKQKISRKIILDTKNRIVSIVHGVGSFIMATYVFLNNHFDQPNSQFETFILLFSLSYCIYDFVACAIFGLADGGLVIHHSLCVIGFGSAMLQGYGAIDSIGGLFVAEVSNFPMHLRVIFRNFGLRYTKGYEFFENVYLVTYIIARGIICPFFVLLPCLKCVNTPITVKIICFSLTAQSFYYILQMTKIIRRKLAQYKQLKEKKVQYRWFAEVEEIKKLSFYRASDGPKIF